MLTTTKVKEYIKCPHCGQEAILDPEVLTSMPPQRRYHCNSCGKEGTIFCHEVEIFAKLEEDSKVENTSTQVNVYENNKDSLVSNEYNQATFEAVDTKLSSKCEICDKEIEIPCHGLDYNYLNAPHICDECREILKVLVRNAKINIRAYNDFFEMVERKKK